jgi:hypothetical protein
MSDRGSNINGTSVRPHVAAARPSLAQLAKRFAIMNGRQIEDGPMTRPLFDWEAIEDAVYRAKLNRGMKHHLECWAKYLLRQHLPPAWRGYHDLFQYERLICHFVKLIRPDYDIGVGPRIRRRKWLRKVPRDQQREAHEWLKSLPPKTRASLAESYRFEQTARQADRRRINKANRVHGPLLQIIAEQTRAGM